MMIYYAKVKKQKDNKFIIEFKDIENAFTEGGSLEEALQNAKEVLDGMLAALCDHNLKIPNSKPYKGRGYYPISVDVNLEFVINLRRLRKKKKLTQTQVAKKLDISQQAYARLETPFRSNPSLQTIQKLSKALDVEIELKLVA